MQTHLSPPHRDFHPGEFVLVIALAFGLPIIGSIDAVLSYSNKPVVFSDTALAGTLFYELVIGVILWLILRAWKWKWSDFAVHYSNGSTVLGLLLAAITLLVWCVLELVIGKAPNVLTRTLPFVLALSVS